MTMIFLLGMFFILVYVDGAWGEGALECVRVVEGYFHEVGGEGFVVVEVRWVGWCVMFGRIVVVFCNSIIG